MNFMEKVKSNIIYGNKVNQIENSNGKLIQMKENSMANLPKASHNEFHSACKCSNCSSPNVKR